MILKIKDALDNISPDQALIDRTELLLRARCNKKKIGLYRNLTIAASLLFVIGAFSATGYACYQIPVSYIDVDINPSLELGVNILSRVVDVRFFNADAENLIDEHSLSGYRPEEAVDLIFAAADKKGYISHEEISVVSLALSGRQTKRSEALLDSCAESITTLYEDLLVYKSTLPGELRREADVVSISAGKLHLIKMIQTLDPSATVDEYRDKSVTDIFDRLSALASEDNTGVSAENKSTVRKNIEGVTAKLGTSANSGNDQSNETAAGAQSSSAQSQSGATSDLSPASTAQSEGLYA